MVPIYLSRVIWSDRFVATQYLSTALRERRQPSVYRIAWGWFLNGFFFYCLLWSLIRDGCELSVYPMGTRLLVTTWVQALLWRIFVCEPLLVFASFYTPWAISTYVLRPGSFVA